MTITIEKYLNEIKSRCRGRCAFRGQADSKWKLHSAATRRLIKHHDENVTKGTHFPKIYTIYHRDVLIEPARTKGFGIDDGHQISDLQLLAKLQHFGAATGLLDFTWDPLVALWFACEKNDCNGKVFVINLNDPGKFQRISSKIENQIEETFSPENVPDKQLYWEPITRGEVAPRVLRQRSVFVIGRPLVPEDLTNIIEIQASDKAPLRKELKDILDIDELSLFTDIHGFSAANSAEASIHQIEDPNYYLFQANQFFQQGDYQKAINSYDECIRLAPDIGETYFLRGNAKAEIKDYKGAKQDYDMAIEHKDKPFHNMNPNMIVNPLLLYPVYFNRGNVKSELSDYEGAINDYTEAIQLHPLEWGKRPALFFNRANANTMLQEFEDAINDYDEAIHLGSRGARFNKGNMLVISGRFDEAIRCYDEAIKEGGGSSGATDNRNAAKAILDRIDGMDYESHFLFNARLVTVSVKNVDYDQNLAFPFRGNIGNTGNQGGSGLPGGEGFEGKEGFTVKVTG